MTVGRVINLLILLSLTALAGCSKKSPADEYLQDAAALKRGKSIFVGTCGAYCHSFSKGPRDAPYLFDCIWLHGGGDQDLFNSIANGVANTRMISFDGKLPDGNKDIWKIIAFLKSNRESCSG